MSAGSLPPSSAPASSADRLTASARSRESLDARVGRVWGPRAELRAEVRGELRDTTDRADEVRMASGTAEGSGAAGVNVFRGFAEHGLMLGEPPKETSSVPVCDDSQLYRKQSAVIRAVHPAFSCSPQSVETVPGAPTGRRAEIPLDLPAARFRRSRAPGARDDAPCAGSDARRARLRSTPAPPRPCRLFRRPPGRWRRPPRRCARHAPRLEAAAPA